MVKTVIDKLMRWREPAAFAVLGALTVMALMGLIDLIRYAAGSGFRLGATYGSQSFAEPLLSALLAGLVLACLVTPATPRSGLVVRLAVPVAAVGLAVGLLLALIGDLGGGRITLFFVYLAERLVSVIALLVILAAQRVLFPRQSQPQFPPNQSYPGHYPSQNQQQHQGQYRNQYSPQGYPSAPAQPGWDPYSSANVAGGNTQPPNGPSSAAEYSPVPQSGPGQSGGYSSPAQYPPREYPTSPPSGPLGSMVGGLPHPFDPNPGTHSHASVAGGGIDRGDDRSDEADAGSATQTGIGADRDQDQTPGHDRDGNDDDWWSRPGS